MVGALASAWVRVALAPTNFDIRCKASELLDLPKHTMKCVAWISVRVALIAKEKEKEKSDV